MKISRGTLQGQHLLRELIIVAWNATKIPGARRQQLCQAPTRPAEPVSAGLSLLIPVNCSFQLCRQETEFVLQTLNENYKKLKVYEGAFIGSQHRMLRDGLG